MLPRCLCSASAWGVEWVVWAAKISCSHVPQTRALFSEHKGISFFQIISSRRGSSPELMHIYLLERNHQEYRLPRSLPPLCNRRFSYQYCRMVASQPATTSELQAGSENLFFFSFFLFTSLPSSPPPSLLHILRKTIAFSETTSRISSSYI